MRIALAVALLALVFPAAADQAQANEKRVTLGLPAANVKVAMEALFKDSGKSYVLPQPIAHQPTPPLSIVEVPFELALRALCTSSGLTWKSEGGKYVISAAPQPSSDSQSPSKGGQPFPAQEPAVGMNKYALVRAVGKPEDSVVYAAGDEIWFYRDWVVKFKNARVASVESAATTKLTFKVSGKPVPYFEVLRMQGEARAKAAAAEKRQVAEAYTDWYNRTRYVVLKGDASDLATMAQYGQYPNTVFIHGVR